MNTHAYSLRHPAGAAVALAAAAGFVLAGCSSPSSGSGSGSSNSSGSSGTSSAATSSKSASTNSGGSTSVISSNSVPFPIAVGNTWRYKDTNLASGGTTVDKIAAVTPVSGGQQVTMDGTISTGAGSLTTHSTGYFIFHSDGSITYPFNQFNTNSSTTKVALLSGDIMFPSASALASGQVSHGTLKIQFTSNGVTQDVTAHITVKGGGTQTVTVPSGTYSASVVDMTMSETIEGITVGTEVMTWFANNVGPVKSEVIIDEAGTGHVEGVNELTSFSKG
jgi:hypothetical protein